MLSVSTCNVSASTLHSCFPNRCSPLISISLLLLLWSALKNFQVSSQSTVFKSVHRAPYSSQFIEDCVRVSSQSTVSKSVHRGLCSSQLQRTAFKAIQGNSPWNVFKSVHRAVFKSVHRLCSSQSNEDCVQVSSQRIVFRSVHRRLWRTVAGG